MELSKASLGEYLSHHHGQPVQVLELKELGDKTVNAIDTSATDGTPLKLFGYGRPTLVRYRLHDQERRVVLRVAAANEFGHENRADRAADMLLSYDTYNALPRHIAALDVGIFCQASRPTQISAPAQIQMLSIGAGDEFFLLTPYVDGVPYAEDLQRLRDGAELQERDLSRVRQLASYLAQIHALKYAVCGTDGRPSPSVQSQEILYRRRIRETLGSGEGIMGLIDSYPADDPLVTPAWLEEVEKECVHWRWRLKARSYRLCQVHGDYHPFNILFTDDNNFVLLDRSRGVWGEPADDVSCLAINYLFFSLQRTGRLAPPFHEMWQTFWQTYLDHTDDRELLTVVVPFLVWRALVLGSPIWYDTPDRVRLALYHFIEQILRVKTFDPGCINEYCMI
jgi:hypothetical protein